MKITTFLVTAVLFLIVGFLVVSYAAGYKIDFVNRSMRQTAMIDIQTKTKDSEIYLNNKLVGTESHVARDLDPGVYEVRVSKVGYHDWNKSVKLNAGQAEVLNDIKLFLLEPKIEEFVSDLNIPSLLKLSDTDNIVSSAGEIYQNGQLVTRLSSDIQGVCWYPDRKYIAFSTNSKLNIVEIDGTNLIEILEKDSSSPVIFVNSGVSVIYENKGKVFRATIR